MIVTILAAGSQSRLQDITGDMPKSLYPLTPKGDSLLSFLLAGLMDWDMTALLLIAGDAIETFSKYCATRVPRKIKVIRANPDYVKGPLFTFLTALPVFAEDTTLIFPADLYIAPQGYVILKNLIKTNNVCLFTQPLQPFHHGPVFLNGKVGSQKNVISAPDAQTILPIAQITPDFATFAQECAHKGVNKVLDALIAWQDAGNTLEFISIPPFFWVDVDTPESMVMVQRFLHSKKT
ncbi:MAG: hypothetical protein RBG13Loki_2865 [Promethearchaeota archaeon CR_4]|nr:MAG: hypothetical protein RBG13Loki_2865 [Candidatus Lokiarchaeota archaeon CR_4]